MRPLIQPLEKHEAAELHRSGAVLAALLDRLGAYCSICERPLFEQAFVWDSDAGASVMPWVNRRSQPSPGPRCLLLCARCEPAQVVKEHSPDGLSLPFDGPTFALEGGGEYVYSPDGEVEPQTGGAQRCLRYFDLVEPRPGDPRSELRARTWKLARRGITYRVADSLSGREARWVVDLMMVTGYLSVWCTALVEELGAARAVSLLDYAREVHPREFFPGTDWERLLRPPPEAQSDFEPELQRG